MSFIDRRSLVRLGSFAIISVASVTAFGLIGGVPPANASGEGYVVLGADNYESVTTGIHMESGTGDALQGIVDAGGAGNGVYGDSGMGDGVYGNSGSGIGVYATTAAANQWALYATSASSSGGHIETGLQYGAGLEVAINNTTNGRGAIETQTSGYGPAIQATSANGPSVDAVGGHNLALLAQGSSRFSGKTTFARSGTITISAGQNQGTKSSIALSSSSLVLATIQPFVPKVWIEGVTTTPGSSGSFTVHLNTSAPSTVVVAWFVVN